MRAAKFFVAWELLLGTILLKFAGLAGWIATLVNYGDFWHYFQLWYAFGLFSANLLLAVWVCIGNFEGGRAWQETRRGGYYGPHIHINRKGWL